MENKNKMNLEKKILIAEALFVFGVFVYLFFSISPNAISPISGQVVSDPDFVFEIENGEEVLVSKSMDFANPILLKEGDEIVLPPGTYYWKVKGLLRDSEVYTFVIQGNVGLNLREGEENNLLENSGNVPVDLQKEKGGITSTGVLDVGKSEEVGKDTNVEGEQNE